MTSSTDFHLWDQVPESRATSTTTARKLARIVSTRTRTSCLNQGDGPARRRPRSRWRGRLRSLGSFRADAAIDRFGRRATCCITPRISRHELASISWSLAGRRSIVCVPHDQLRSTVTTGSSIEFDQLNPLIDEFVSTTFDKSRLTASSTHPERSRDVPEGDRDRDLSPCRRAALKTAPRPRDRVGGARPTSGSAQGRRNARRPSGTQLVGSSASVRRTTDGASCS